MFHTMLQQWQPFLFVAGLFIMLGWESLAPYFPVRRRMLHAARNLTLSGLNAVLLALVFGGLTISLSTFAATQHFGILNWLGVPPPVNGVIAFFMLDFWTYWWHRFNHTVPFLWRFHRMHHSDPEMDVTTATRFHLGEIILSSCVRLALIPLIGIPIWTLIVYDVVLLACTQFHHANVSLPAKVDKLLRYVIVSPYMHKVHHSQIQRETDSNFTSIFSLWDRVFGSYAERENYHEIVFGVAEFSSDEMQTLKGLIVSPLVQPPHQEASLPA